MTGIDIVVGKNCAGGGSLRLLAQSRQARVVAIASRGDAGKLVSGIFPGLRGRCRPHVREFGQVVQSMYPAFGLDETAGSCQLPLLP